MSKIDLSTEALLDRKAIAERATPGSWEHIIKCGVGTDNGHTVPLRIAVTNFEEDATHIAANSPDVVIATIDELLRLREDNERLEKEADWLAERLAKYCVDDAEKECPLIDVCPEGSCPTITTSSWREVARRAVEE